MAGKQTIVAVNGAIPKSAQSWSRTVKGPVASLNERRSVTRRCHSAYRTELRKRSESRAVLAKPENRTVPERAAAQGGAVQVVVIRLYQTEMRSSDSTRGKDNEVLNMPDRVKE